LFFKVKKRLKKFNNNNPKMIIISESDWDFEIWSQDG